MISRADLFILPSPWQKLVCLNTTLNKGHGLHSSTTMADIARKVSKGLCAFPPPPAPWLVCREGSKLQTRPPLRKACPQGGPSGGGASNRKNPTLKRAAVVGVLRCQAKLLSPPQMGEWVTPTKNSEILIEHAVRCANFAKRWGC